jgi:hypothetical protein
LENLDGYILLGSLGHMIKDTGNVASLSLWKFCEGNLEGGSLTGDRVGYVKEVSGNEYLSPLGPVGEPVGG